MTGKEPPCRHILLGMGRQHFCMADVLAVARAGGARGHVCLPGGGGSPCYIVLGITEWCGLLHSL